MGAQNSKQGIHELDLAWNQIQGAGALALITALANQAKPTVCEHVCSLPLYHTGCSPTVSPQALDLSWNALGKHDDGAKLRMKHAIRQHVTGTTD